MTIPPCDNTLLTMIQAATDTVVECISIWVPMLICTNLMLDRLQHLNEANVNSTRLSGEHHRQPNPRDPVYD